MRNLLLSLTLLFTLNACGDAQEEAAKQAKLIQEANKAKAEKDALLVELKAKEKALAKAREEARSIQAKLLAEEKARKEAFLKAEARKAEAAKHIATQQTTNKKLSPVGIEIKENKITIDTNKTKDFFQQLGKNIEAKMTQLTQKLEKGIVDEKEAGVHIDDSHINIDLNKTKDFLETWGKQLQGFVKEFDNMAKEIDNKSQQINNTETKGN